MLELKKISKVYNSFEFKQKALDNVSINFRESEFASILGPSGSGKTTLLNIIGGLDQYTSGDLIINNISTKDYKDRDWDTYRNYRVGFVFQSYNLISHQSILSNVELALTLSGVSKQERKARAKEALIKVGLEKHINKKPSQLSGGQMQRVAIARALVNDPDIILADEPTGALDSETSVQIMKLLKEVSKDKLVIMVTHNPELANEYSTRIIKLKDGKVTDDSNPYDGKENKNLTVKEDNKKTSMSFKTALGLSFNNLMTKKGRTLLVAFAGSIGIIGIALILSLSTGFQNYIDSIQEDTLSSYPLTITSETADMTSLLLSMVGSDKDESKSEIVKEKQFISSMFSSISSNDLKSFKSYIEKNNDKIKDDISSVKYLYSVSPYIYTIDASDSLVKLNPSSIFSSIYSSSMSNMYSSYSSIFSQMSDDMTKIKEQYEVLDGRWPEKFNEMVIVLPDKNTISDLLVYSLGLRKTEELNEMITKIMAGESVNINNEPMEFTYEDLMNIDLRIINQYETYKYNSKYNIYEDMSEDNDYMEKLYDNALKLKIVGVVTSKSSSSMILSAGVAYRSDLIDYVINQAYSSEIVKKQLNNKDINVISNTKFDEETSKSKLDFEDMISIDKDMLQSAFGINISQQDMEKIASKYMESMAKSITTDTSKAKSDFDNSLKNVASNILNDLSKNNTIIYYNDVGNIVDEQIKNDSNSKIINELNEKYVIPSDVFESTFKQLLTGLLQGYIEVYNQLDSSLTTDPNNKGALVISSMIDSTINSFMSQAIVAGVSETMSSRMTEAVMQKSILTDAQNMMGSIVSSFASAFNVDEDKIAGAFKFNLSEEELKRIMTAMMSSNGEENAKSNLIKLGYQDKDDPTSISFYFNSFDSKENFIEFLEDYNDKMEKSDLESKVIKYTDTTGILMSSVKKVVNTVSYVLMAFVSISLVVSSIMIAIITYISVLERTKEIGILRAVGASKKDVKMVFNAETLIEGLGSGILGILVTLIICIPINIIIKNLIDVSNIASLPFTGAILLILLSMFLTLIAGAIPSRIASKKDPVESLRSE